MRFVQKYCENLESITWLGTRMPVALWLAFFVVPGGGA
jgi:hypothetical protein